MQLSAPPELGSSSAISGCLIDKANRMKISGQLKGRARLADDSLLWLIYVFAQCLTASLRSRALNCPKAATILTPPQLGSAVRIKMSCTSGKLVSFTLLLSFVCVCVLVLVGSSLVGLAVIVWTGRNALFRHLLSNYQSHPQWHVWRSPFWPVVSVALGEIVAEPSESQSFSSRLHVNRRWLWCSNCDSDSDSSWCCCCWAYIMNLSICSRSCLAFGLSEFFFFFLFWLRKRFDLATIMIWRNKIEMRLLIVSRYIIIFWSNMLRRRQPQPKAISNGDRNSSDLRISITLCLGSPAERTKYAKIAALVRIGTERSWDALASVIEMRNIIILY